MSNTKKLKIISVAILLIAVVIVATLLLFQPSQFDAEIRDTVEKVRSYPSDLTLVLITDLHYDPSKYSYETGEINVLEPTFNSISSVVLGLEKRKGKVDALWNLGDFINGHGTTKAEATEQIRTVLSEQNKVSTNFHNIVGNHDKNIHATWYDPPQPESEILSAEEVNNLLKNKSTTQIEHHNPGFPTDYYVDFGTIRVVCLSADNTTFQQSTVDWLRGEALDTDKEVLFLSHLPTRPEWGFKNDIVGGEEIEAVIREFMDRGGTVIAYIHGHDHGDMISSVTDEEGKIRWHEICIGCARFQYPTSNGTEGMTFWMRNEKDKTELLFDVVSIDQESKTIHFTRFGAGEDRETKYTTNP